jgi:hypothetical protein
MRRLVGEAAFDQHIAPKLMATTLAAPSAQRPDMLDDFLEDKELAEMQARQSREATLGQPVPVYSQLHEEVFGQDDVRPRRLAVSEDIDPLPLYSFHSLWLRCRRSPFGPFAQLHTVTPPATMTTADAAPPAHR